MDNHDNEIERRRFPAIAFGVTALVVALILLLIATKLVGPKAKAVGTKQPGYIERPADARQEPGPIQGREPER